MADFEEYLEQHGDTYLTIEQEGEIAGGTGYVFTHNHTTGQITWIFFHPDFAGKGLGKLAVQHCLDIFRSQPGITKLLVTTSQLAYRFFEKFGYQLVATEKDHWGPGLDLYTMEMDC